MTLSFPHLQPAQPRLSPGQLAAVALAHAGLLAMLLNAPDALEAVTPPHALTVSLIEDEQAEPQPEPRPTPSQAVVKPLSPPPVLAARQTAPTMQPVVETTQPDLDPDPVPEGPPTPAPVVTDAPKPAPPSAPTPPRAADYLNNPKPPYPALSRRLGEAGVVQLRALINPDGSVAQIQLLRSSGFERLDSAALNTVRDHWKFEPARQNGQAVAEWVNFPVEFILKDRS